MRLKSYALDQWIEGTCTAVTLASSAIRRALVPRHRVEPVSWDCTVTNQDGQVVAQYDVLTMVAKRAG